MYNDRKFTEYVKSQIRNTWWTQKHYSILSRPNIKTKGALNINTLTQNIYFHTSRIFFTLLLKLEGSRMYFYK